MKTMKTIPFDIALRSEIQSKENKYLGRYKVQTRSGKSARIICWDNKNPEFPIAGLPIAALVEDSSHSNETAFLLLLFRKDGMCCGTSDNDLCLIDTWEPKFKVGDTIRNKVTDIVRKIVKLNDTHYSAIDPFEPISYNHSHSYCISYKCQDLYELISEESELTDFEKELANCLSKSIIVRDVETLAKECAPKLLELAKKEIIEKLKEE